MIGRVFLCSLAPITVPILTLLHSLSSFLPPSLSISLPRSFSLCLCLSLFLSAFLTLTVCLSLSLCLCLSLSCSLSLFLSLFLSLSFCMSLSLCLSLSICLTLSLNYLCLFSFTFFSVIVFNASFKAMKEEVHRHSTWPLLHNTQPVAQ